MRTWGFNDRNATTDPNGLPNYGGEGAGETNVVLQTWKNGKAKIDVRGFDKVVNGASKTGMKLIVALTNNWADYGGMDVYTVNLGGKYHDDASKLLCLSIETNAPSSFTATPRSRRLSRSISRLWSTAISILPLSWPGSLPMSPVAALMETGTCLEVTTALPRLSANGSLR